MKKNFILIIALILLVVGCGKKKEENVENNIDNFEKNKKEIIDYFKENLSGIWSYSEGKIIVNDDYSVELALYNIDNWIKCGDSSELFIELLQDSDKSRLNKVSELTFVCRNNNFDVSGKTIISDIKNTSHDNFSNNSKIYDENGNIMNVRIFVFHMHIKKYLEIQKILLINILLQLEKLYRLQRKKRIKLNILF